MRAPGVHRLGVLPLKPLPDYRSGDPENHLDRRGRHPPRRARGRGRPVCTEGLRDEQGPESGHILELWEKR